ncbi:MAG: sigma 54-interacting transcriptional regulator [Bryobacteraceae bacterium]
MRQRFYSLLIKVLWITGENTAETSLLTDYPGISLIIASSLSEAMLLLDSEEFDAILATVPFAGGPVEVLLQAALKPGTQTPVVVHAPEARLADAVRLTKLGAYHVLGDASAAPSALHAAANAKRARAAASSASVVEFPIWRRMLIGRSQKIQNIAEVIRLIAPRRCTVLISGETGTGKEVAARAIHAASGRAHLNIVSVNCSALPEHLLEAELFGHTKGAFTGAAGSRIGHFEQAHRGTLFLDEIADLPLALQSKLLRVLQEREFQRLGSSETVRVDVRVIAATNADLAQLVRQGKFREDLYYRLNVVPLCLPPLRERPSDIACLAVHFIEKICREEGLPQRNATPEALDRLARYEWPGNVRQLENAVEMAIALSGDDRVLGPSDFPLPVTARAFTHSSSGLVAVPDHGLDFEQTVGNIERHILEQALQKTGGNKKMAAEMLRLKRTTLSAKLKSLSAVAAG